MPDDTGLPVAITHSVQCHRWRNWCIVAAIALVLRLVFALWTGRLARPETWEYEFIAQHLLRGEGFIYAHMNTIYRSYCEPLYPWFAASVYALTNHHQGVLVFLQAILSSLTALVAMQCAWWAIKDRRVAFVAGLLVAMHPGLIMYTTKLHPVVLDALFFALVAWSSVRYASQPTRGRALIIGVLGGMCFLTRPTIVLVMPLILVWVWQMTHAPVRVRYARVLSVLLVAVAVGSPWVIRNIAIHQQFMLTRSNTPYVFWLGNNPHASGSSQDAQGRDMLDLAPVAFRTAVLASADEREQNRLFKEAALIYIREDPAAFIQRLWTKWVAFWWFSPQAGRLYPVKWMTAYRVWWALVAIAGLWGIWRVSWTANSVRQSCFFLLGIGLIVGAAQSAFYVEGRHRLVVEPLLITLVAFGIVQLWTSSQRACHESRQ